MVSVLTLSSGRRHVPRPRHASPLIDRLAATYEPRSPLSTSIALPSSPRTSLRPRPLRPISGAAAGPAVQDLVQVFQAADAADAELDRSLGSLTVTLDGLRSKQGSPSAARQRPLTPAPPLRTPRSTRPVPTGLVAVSATTVPTTSECTLSDDDSNSSRTTSSLGSPSPKPKRPLFATPRASQHSVRGSPWTDAARHSPREVTPIRPSRSMPVDLILSKVLSGDKSASPGDAVQDVDSSEESAAGEVADDSGEVVTATVAKRALAHGTSLGELFGCRLTSARTAGYLDRLASVRTFLSSHITTVAETSLPLWEDTASAAEFEQSLRSGFALAHLARSLGDAAFSEEARPIDRLHPLGNIPIFLDFLNHVGLPKGYAFGCVGLYEGRAEEVVRAVECVHALMLHLGGGDATASSGGTSALCLTAYAPPTPEQSDSLTLDHSGDNTCLLQELHDSGDRSQNACHAALQELQAEITNVSIALDALGDAFEDRDEHIDRVHSKLKFGGEDHMPASLEYDAMPEPVRGSARKRHGRVWDVVDEAQCRAAELAVELDADHRRRTSDAERFRQTEDARLAREAGNMAARRKRRIAAAFEAELALGGVGQWADEHPAGGRTRGDLVRLQFSDTLAALRDGPERPSDGIKDAWDRRVCGRVMADIQMLRLLAETLLGEHSRVPERSEVRAFAALDLTALETELERWVGCGFLVRWAQLLWAWMAKIGAVQVTVRARLALQGPDGAEEDLSTGWEPRACDIQRQSTKRSHSTRSSLTRLRVSLRVPADAAYSDRRDSRVFEADRHAQRQHEAVALQQQLREATAELAKREAQLQLLRFKVDLLRGDKDAAQKSCPVGYIISTGDKPVIARSPQLSLHSLGTAWSGATSSMYDLRAQAASLRTSLATLEIKLSSLSLLIADFIVYIRRHLGATHRAAAAKVRIASPWSLQAHHAAEQREWKKAFKFGSFAYSVKQLEGKGVLAGMQKWTARGWEGSVVVLSCGEAGKYGVEVGPPRGAGVVGEVGLVELLEMQFRQERYWRLEDVATFDLDKLIDLIKHKFMA